jgi:hypothetical protein
VIDSVNSYMRVYIYVFKYTTSAGLEKDCIHYSARPIYSNLRSPIWSITPKAMKIVTVFRQSEFTIGHPLD